MEGMSITAVWRLLTWLPKFILERIFTRERLADLILVDVRPRHDYCTVNLGRPASFQLWMNFLNISPFDVEIDRAELKFYCSGTENKSLIIERKQILAGKLMEYMFSENIGSEHARQIAENISSDQTSLELVVEFNCRLHNFKKVTGRLEGLRPKFINEGLRLP